MTTYRRVDADGSISSGEPLSPDQVELLKRRGAMFDDFVADSAPIVDEFIRMVLVVDPAPYLTNIDMFVGSIDEMVGNAEIAERDKMFLFTRLVYFVGEYFIRLHRGSWQIDAVPFSRTFGQYVIHVPLDSEGLGTMSLSPADIARAYVDAAPPRRLRPVLQGLVERIAAARRSK